MIFKNRQEAGRLLAEKLKHFNFSDVVIFGLPRGGIPIGFEVAKVLQVPLEVLVVRKIGAPGNSEYGIGAITEGDYFWIAEEAARDIGATRTEIERTVLREKEELSVRIHKYRQGRPHVPVQGRSVLIVDDGLATGVTARVACRYLKSKGAKSVTCAVPVGSRTAVEMLQGEADQVICLNQPDHFFAVGNWYEEFYQVSDQEVIEFLNRNHDEILPKRKVFEINTNKGVPMGGSQLYLSEEVEIPAENEFLSGHLEFPSVMDGFVVFAHGSGSNRFSPRNHIVAQILHKAGIGTLLFNLLSAEEANDRRNVFNIPFLANRLLSVMRWVEEQNIMESFPVGLFGASTGASAALWAAAELGNKITAVVSRGGRPDLALTRLREVTAPTLLIVGGYDEPVVEMNEAALHYLSHGKLIVVPGATHLFEEPGTLQQVANHAANWFQVHFRNISHVKAA